MVQDDKSPNMHSRFSSVSSFVEELCGEKSRVIEKILILNNGMTAVHCIRSVRLWASEVFGNDRAIQFVVIATPENVKDDSELLRLADVVVESFDCPNSKTDDLDVNHVLEIVRNHNVDAVWAGRVGDNHNSILSDALESLDPPISFIGPDGSLSNPYFEHDIPKGLSSGEEVAQEQKHRDNGCSFDSFDEKVLVKSVAEANEVAQRLGFPVMIRLLNDGKIFRDDDGLRLVSRAEEMEDAYRQLSEQCPECSIFINKLPSNVRNVVVPFLADKFGNVVAMIGRDCSIQRCHKNIIVEESPPVAIPAHIWERIEETAFRVVKHAKYVYFGRMEFLYAEAEQKFYYLLLRPYLDFDSPVMDMVTKVNIPSFQLQVTMGIKLSNIPDIRELFGRNRIEESYGETTTIEFGAMKPFAPFGHCLVLHLEVEGKGSGTEPDDLSFISTPNVRGCLSRSKSYSKSEIAHLIANGNNREEARHNMIDAMKELSAKMSIRENAKVILEVLQHDDFVKNKIDTVWLDKNYPNNFEDFQSKVGTGDCDPCTSVTDLPNENLLHNDVKAVLGALIVAYDSFSAEGQHRKFDTKSVTLVLNGMKYRLCCKYCELDRFQVSVYGCPEKYVVTSIRRNSDGGYATDIGGKSRIVYLQNRNEASSDMTITIEGTNVSFSSVFEAVAVKTNIAGTFVKMIVSDSSYVNKDDNICELNVMNESILMKASETGYIRWKIHQGASLKQGDIVAYIEPDSPDKNSAITVFQGDLDVEGWCEESKHKDSEKSYFMFKNPFESFNSGMSGYIMSQHTFNAAFDDLKKAVANPLIPVYDADPTSTNSETVDTKVPRTGISSPPSPQKSADLDGSKKTKGIKDTVVNHDKCLAQLRQLEKEFNSQISEKDEVISEMKEQINDLLRQVDQLSLECEGLNKTIQAGKQRLSEVDDKDKEIESLKESLAATKNELEATNESYSTLKSRVKSVATELKERRTECRALTVNVQELTIVKSHLESEHNHNQMRISNLESLVEIKDKEIESLNSNIIDLRTDLKEKEKELAEKGSLNETALESYKKKAQASLAQANARAAAANQAREEAEIDASNAKKSSLVALSKLKDAEEKRDAIIAQTQEEKNYYLDQINEFKTICENLNKELADTKVALKDANEERFDACKSRDQMFDDLSSKIDEIERERERCAHLNQEIATQQLKNKELEDEIRFLKDELDTYTSAAFMVHQTDNAEQTKKPDVVSMGVTHHSSETDGTIAMLQQELKVANDVIKDLKEALGAILSTNPSSIEPKEIIKDVQGGMASQDTLVKSTSISYDDKPASMPLLYAFEKQVELNTAREEITRLAALLGDAESAKVEAFDAMEEMRKKMEEAEARLRRYEKLTPGNNSRFMGSSNLNATKSFANRNINGSTSTGSTRQALLPQNDSTVNLEYLKNIVLRFMNATSLNEKRALVPVISAVLELTADEQLSALRNLEKSANVTGVGVSLIENIQNKGFSGIFS